MSIERKNRLRKSFRRHLRVESLENRRVLAFEIPVETPDLVVNTTQDISSSTDDYLSLREAIEEANMSAGAQDILFAIPLDDPGYNPVNGSWRIQPTSPLPQIDDTVNILGGNVFSGNVPIFPFAYSGPNGYTGNHTYWDESYNGSGDKEADGAELFGGFGDLTDGIVAQSNWDVEEVAENGPYVGWVNIDPTITFEFFEQTQFQELRVYLDDADGRGGVRAPASIIVNDNIFSLGEPEGSDPFVVLLDLSLLEPTSTLTVQLMRANNESWVFASEFEFVGLGEGAGIVELNGELAGSGTHGLHLAGGSSNSIVNGLVINGFGGAGIRIESNGNTISGNLIGTDVTGSTAIGNRNGIEIISFNPEQSASDNLIVDNLISGNGGVEHTVSAQAEPWDWNEVLNTAFQFGVQDGLPATIIDLASLEAEPGDTISVGYRRGLTDAFNFEPSVDGNGYVGSEFKNDDPGSSGNGFPSKYVNPEEYDVYLNALIGVFTDDEGNIITKDDAGNIIRNPLSIKNGRELIVPAGATRLQLGVNDDVFDLNRGELTVVVSGPRFGIGDPNNGNGVLISGFGPATGNELRNNLIGTDISGSYGIGNTHDGVAIFNPGATGNYVGGPHNPNLEQFSRNVIAGNGAHGVDIAFGASNNFVQGNLIGVNSFDGGESISTFAIPNGGVGVLINFGSNGNKIGTDLDGFGDEIEGNVISGNTQTGVQIEGSSGNSIAGNLIGTDVLGISALGNAAGVAILGGAHHNTVGGLDANQGNVISGNAFGGVEFVSGATNNQIVGNLIGTDVSGQEPIPNDVGIRLNGFFDQTSENEISNNVISGNNFGIILFGSQVFQNRIEGNLIGTNIDGDLPLGNNNDGIRILAGADNNSVGGEVTGGSAGVAPGNVISWNGGSGIYIEDSDSTNIQGNLIGIVGGLFSSSAPNQRNGIHLVNASNSQIGGVSTNFISSNAWDGIYIENRTITETLLLAVSSVPAGNNTILGNFIGTGGLGTESTLGNSGDGIEVQNSSGNVISSNLIASNQGNGIFLNGFETYGTEIVANLIGTDPSRTSPLGNGGHGIEILSAHDNIIGGEVTLFGSPGFHPGNVIVDNGGNGISITDSFSTDEGEVITNNIIQGNLIGISRPDSLASASIALGNRGHGVYVVNSSYMLIGGEAAGTRNIISSNGQDGVHLVDFNFPASDNTVQGNYIGTDHTGSIGMGNGDDGVEVNNTDRNRIANNVISGNGVENAGGDGVDIVGFAAFANTVIDNLIGTNAAGTAAIGNSGNGVFIQFAGSENTVIDNLISGNELNGVRVQATNSVMVAGNTVGTNVSGDDSIGNGENGILVEDSSFTQVVENLVSGNALNGVLILDHPPAENSHTSVLDNLIGTNRSGSGSIANGMNGVEIDQSDNNSVSGNLISGNQQNGIYVHGASAVSNVITSNKIGVDSSSNNKLPNKGNGILLLGDAVDTVIGGLTPVPGTALGNIIAGNDQSGIVIDHVIAAMFPTRATIQGNAIGASSTGTALGNGRSGVLILNGASRNTIGGTASGARNIIAYNGADGVTIGNGNTDPALGNAIRGNSIFANGEQGIDLGANGVTNNDVGDADGGPNQRQNTPVITGITPTATGPIIYGNLNSVPNHSFDIELFDNLPSEDEGRNLLGVVTVTTDASGNASFSLTTVGGLTGRSITATATQTSGLNRNTSEFSPAAVVNADVTQFTSITRSGFTLPRPGVLQQTLTIRNTSGSDLSGPIYVMLENLAPANALTGVLLGTTTLPILTSGGGNKYFVLPLGALNKFASGATISVRLQFNTRPNAYGIKILSGTGPV